MDMSHKKNQISMEILPDRKSYRLPLQTVDAETRAAVSNNHDKRYLGV